jgi:hypothetical protein
MQRKEQGSNDFVKTPLFLVAYFLDGLFSYFSMKLIIMISFSMASGDAALQILRQWALAEASVPGFYQVPQTLKANGFVTDFHSFRGPGPTWTGPWEGNAFSLGPYQIVIQG